MTREKSKAAMRLAVAAIAFTWQVSTNAATTDIAPAPLANTSTAVVKPNLMFILDASGSMQRAHMPNYVNGNRCKDANETLRDCAFGDPAYNAYTFNAMYYNPNTTYRPPVLYDGASMKSYDDTGDWASVPEDGFGIQSTARTDLLNAYPDIVWCKDSSPPSRDHTAGSIGGDCRTPINYSTGIWEHKSDRYDTRVEVRGTRRPYYYAHSIYPVQWCDSRHDEGDLIGFGRGVYPPVPGEAGCSLLRLTFNPHNDRQFVHPKYGSWSRVDITPDRTSYPRASSRTDCSGLVGLNGCSYTEEMTNFANWWAYYRTRLQTMKSAAGHVFANVDDKFRVGFITISPGNPVDRGQFLKIDDFNATHKRAWYEKFYAQDTGGGTPLRRALARVGRYYANVTDGINSGMRDDPIQYSCQQNFAILTTDGRWTEGEGVKLDDSLIGDEDSDLETAPRPMYDGEKTPAVLADVAQYYYITDLRPAGSIGALNTDVSVDNVPGKPASDPQNDSASHQHMTTFTLGLGVDGTLEYKPDYRENPSGDFLAIKDGTRNWPIPEQGRDTSIDDLWHAAVTGRGKYFSAKDPASLTAGLTEALVGVNATIGSATAAATSNLEPIAGDNYVYVANYETVFWNGDVEARTIDLSTGAVSAVPIWSAQLQLDTKTRSSEPGEGLERKIVFYKPGAANNLQDFLGESDYMSATELSWFSSAWISGGGGPQLSQWSTLSAAQQAEAGNPKNLVHFLRGDSTYEAQATNDATFHLYRDRTHVLGDIVNAQPIYVKTTNANYADAGYSEFKNCVNNGAGTGCSGARAASVYIAANDGMLHNLNGDTGEERWAFIPRMLMPKLYRLADQDYANRHLYFVDGSPTVGDVHDPASGDWKTILVGGLNSGGRGYYALDITDENNPVALWEFTVRDTAACPSAALAGDTDDCDLGLSYGNPVITKLTSGEWVVMVTSGYNNVAPGDGKGYLYVLDPISGELKKKIQAANRTQGIDPGDTSSPMGLAKINNWVDNTNTNNTTLRVYAGDLQGNLWRFDPNSGSAYVLAQLRDGRSGATSAPQPVTTKPELGEANRAALIAVGTGRYLGASDLSDSQPQSIYTIKDVTNGVAPTTPIDVRNGTMVEQEMTETTDPVGNPIRTSTNHAVDLATRNGWLVDLPITSERVNVDPRLQLGTLLVASNIPTNDACTAGGTSYLNYFDYRSGSFIASSGIKLVGSKIANSLAAGVSVVRLPNKKTVAIVSTSENKHPTMAPPFQSAAPSGRRNAWRELSPQ